MNSFYYIRLKSWFLSRIFPLPFFIIFDLIISLFHLVISFFSYPGFIRIVSSALEAAQPIKKNTKIPYLALRWHQNRIRCSAMGRFYQCLLFHFGKITQFVYHKHNSKNCLSECCQNIISTGIVSEEKNPANTEPPSSMGFASWSPPPIGKKSLNQEENLFPQAGREKRGNTH